MKVVKRLTSGFVQDHPLLFLALISTVLAAPSLFSGYVFDDYLHMLAFHEHPVFSIPNTKLDMFTFLNGDSETNRQLMNDGILPWWTFENVKAS
ncbi:hypothetical protein JW979_05065, partial [bacterium]|nr:hypothetical protein [candidate division CSSED10-310 bacterium]